MRIVVLAVLIAACVAGCGGGGGGTTNIVPPVEQSPFMGTWIGHWQQGATIIGEAQYIIAADGTFKGTLHFDTRPTIVESVTGTIGKRGNVNAWYYDAPFEGTWQVYANGHLIGTIKATAGYFGVITVDLVRKP